MVGYDSLENFIRTNWAMVHHHKWNHDTLMNMVAWERQIHLALTMAYLKEENERIQQEQRNRR